MSKHAVEDSSSDQLLNIEEAYQCLLDRSKVHEEGEEFRIRTIITPPLKLQNTEYLHALFVKLLENNEFDIATRLFIIARDYPRDSEMLENKDIIQYVKSLTQQMVAHDNFKLLQEILFILEGKHKLQSELSGYELTMRSKSTEDYQRRLVILLDAVNPVELTTLVTSSNYNLLKPEFYPIASKALSSFLEKTTNPEEKQAFFFEMLRGAAIHKNFTFLNSSLLRNFKISKEDKQKLTAKILHSKAGCKDVETLKLLLPRTADSEKKAIILEIVRYAAINDNLEVLRYLLMEVVTDREERQQIINGNNFEIADRLAASRNTDISRFLLMEVVTREKRLEIITRNNFEIFKNLAASGNIDLLEFFLKSFRDPEIQKKIALQIFHGAVLSRNIATLDLIASPGNSLSGAARRQTYELILENDFEVFRSAVSSGNIAFSRFLLKIAIADPAQKIASLKILLQAVADPEERHQIIIHELKEASNNATLLDLLLKEFVLEYIDADERWQKAMDYTDYNSTFSHMFRGALQSVNTDVLNILTNLTPDPEKGKGIATINDIPRYLFFTAVENGNYQFLDFLFRCASEETKLLALTYGDDKSDTLFERSLLCGAHTKVLKLILKEANDYPESRAKLISAASSFFCNNFVNRDGGDIRNATAVFRRLLDVILQNKEIITHSSGRLFSGVINVINSTFATKTTRNFINIGTLELILKALTDSTERAALIINREGLTKSCHNVRTTDLLLKAITPENEISILLPAINFIQSTHLSIDISNRFLLQDFKLSPANRNAIKRLLEASPLHTHGERDIFMLGNPILPSDNPSLQIIKRVYQEACETLLGGLEESETQQLIIEEMARRVGNYIFLNGGIEEIAQARDNFITLKLSSEKAGQPTGISNMIPDVWKTILEFRIPYSFEEVDSADYPGNEVFVELVNTIARKFLGDHRLTPCAIADYEPREVIMDDPPASVLAASAEATARLAAEDGLELEK